MIGDPLCDVHRNLLLSPDNFAKDHFLKKEWLFADVTVVGSHDKEDRDFFGMISSVFWPN